MSEYTPKLINETTFELHEYTPKLIGETTFELGSAVEDKELDVDNTFNTSSIYAFISTKPLSVDNTFTTTSSYDVSVALNVKETSNVFSTSSFFGIRIFGIGVKNIFHSSSQYDFERLGFNENILRVKRATPLNNTRRTALSTFNKRVSIIKGLRSIKAHPQVCGNIRACASLKAKRATVIAIRKNDQSFTTQVSYKTSAIFSSSVETEVYLTKKTEENFSTQSKYNFSGFKSRRLNKPFSTTSIYDIEFLDVAKKVDNTFTTNCIYDLFTKKEETKTSNTFTTNVSYRLTSDKFADSENTFTVTPKYDFFTEKGIAKVENVFSGTPVYSVDTISIFADIDNTFTTDSKYDYKTITEVLSVDNTFTSTPVYDYETIIEFVSVDNTFTTVPKYDLFTEKGIVKVSNTISGVPKYAVDTISILLGIGKGFRSNSKYAVKTFLEELAVSNTFTSSTQYNIETISEFKQVDNTFTTQPSYQLETTSVFAQVNNTFSTTSVYNQQTLTETIQVENNFGTQSFYNQRTVTGFKFLTSSLFSASVSTVVIDTFYAQPNEDISVNYNEWFRSDQDQSENFHYTMLRGVTANDTDYLQSVSTPNNVTAIFGLDPSSGPYANSGQLHQLKVRSRGNGSLGSVNLEVKLYSGATLITTSNYNNRPTSFSTTTLNLTSAQVNQLNYNNIQVGLTANTTDGSNKRMEVSWVQLVIPEVEQ